MKEKYLFVTTMVILIIIGFTQFSLQYTSAKDKTRWEYTTGFGGKSSSFNENVSRLNQLGDQGWELVNFERNSDGDVYFVLKRAKE